MSDDDLLNNELEELFSTGMELPAVSSEELNGDLLPGESIEEITYSELSRFDEIDFGQPIESTSRNIEIPDDYISSFLGEPLAVFNPDGTETSSLTEPDINNLLGEPIAVIQPNTPLENDPNEVSFNNLINWSEGEINSLGDVTDTKTLPQDKLLEQEEPPFESLFENLEESLAENTINDTTFDELLGWEAGTASQLSDVGSSEKILPIDEILGRDEIYQNQLDLISLNTPSGTNIEKANFDELMGWKDGTADVLGTNSELNSLPDDEAFDLDEDFGLDDLAALVNAPITLEYYTEKAVDDLVQHVSPEAANKTIDYIAQRSTELINNPADLKAAEKVVENWLNNGYFASLNTEALENELIAYRYSLAYTPQVDEAIKSLRNMDVSDRHSQELITSLAKITLTETVAGIGLQKLMENQHKEGIDALSSELQELGFNKGSSGLDKEVHNAIKQRGEEISVTINGPITALLQYGRHHIADGLYNQRGAEISINMKSSVDNQIESLIEHSTHTLIHEMVHLTSDSNALVSDLRQILEKTSPVNKLPSEPTEMIRMQTLLYKDNTNAVSTSFYEAIVESFTQKMVTGRLEINYAGVDDSYPRERTALEKTIDAYNINASEPLNHTNFVQMMYRGYAKDGVSLESLLYPTETQTGLEPSQLPKTLFPEPTAFFDFINRFATELDLELRRNNDGGLDDYRIKMDY